MQYRHVNLDQFCITQEEFDREDAPYAIQIMKHRGSYDGTDHETLSNNAGFYILSEEIKCFAMIRGKMKHFWCVKFQLNEHYYALLEKVENTIEITTSYNDSKATYILGLLNGMIIDFPDDHEYVLK